MEKLQAGYVVHDRFHVIEEMDGGGQSFIFKGEDTKAASRRERYVCIKQFEDMVAGSAASKALSQHYEKFAERLGVNFSKVLGKDKQRYICLPLDLTEQYGSVIAVFPWLQGITLEKRMTQPISPPERARIAIALAGAVRGMHEQNIIHVDLSPHQVMVHTFVNNDGQPVAWIQLIDLDAAIVDGETIRGKVLGKVGWASPEHFIKDAKKFVGYPSDIFTLAMMLLLVLLDVHPYEGYAGNRVLYRAAISNGYFRIPAGDYDREVIETLVACLSPDPKARPTAKRLHQTLLNLREAREVLPARRWAGQTGLARSYAQVARPDTSPPFRRIYHQAIKLAGKELRGSGVPANTAAPCELSPKGQGWTIKRLSGDVPVSVGGYPLRLGRATDLGPSQTVLIAGQPFVVSIHAYNVTLKTPQELLPPDAAEPKKKLAPVTPAAPVAKPSPPKPVVPDTKPRLPTPVRPVPVLPPIPALVPSPKPVRAGRVTAVRIDHNVKVDGGQDGMVIAADFSVTGLKGTQTWVGAWVDYATGGNLKDTDGRYRDGEGNVAAIGTFVPDSDAFSHSDYRLPLPYSQTHLPNGKHDVRLYVRILWLVAPGTAQELTRSASYENWVRIGS